jgi:hypothetical protein
MDKIPARKTAKTTFTSAARTLQSASNSRAGRLIVATAKDAGKHIVAAAGSGGNVSNYLNSYYAMTKKGQKPMAPAGSDDDTPEIV